jgi:hypothetical protein
MRAWITKSEKPRSQASRKTTSHLSSDYTVVGGEVSRGLDVLTNYLLYDSFFDENAEPGSGSKKGALTCLSSPIRG